MKSLPAITSFCFFVLISCNSSVQKDNKKASAIYFNGDIITMEGDGAVYTEAILVTDGKIAATGTKAAMMQQADDATQQVDLQGKTLLPAFIDAHGHVGGYAALGAAANLMPAPYGKVMSVPMLQQALRDYIKAKNIPAGVPVIGNGYDDAVMTEHRHPTAAELDAVTTEHPVYIMHTSGHMGVANTLFMKKMGVNYTTPDPPGGLMGRDPKTRQLTGKMMENANIRALSLLATLLPSDSTKDKFAGLLSAEKVWLANGQTTICEGRTSPEQIRLIREAAAKGLLKGDIVVLPDYDANKDSLAVWKQYYNKYDGHFKIGGIKMTFDGSPQGKSAWLTQPYLVPPDGEKPGFRGHPIYTHAAAYAGLKAIFEHGMPAHIHCNGDAAIDEALVLIDSLQKQGLQPAGIRCVLVHAQVTRPDHLARFKQLNIIPSWFPTHCYLWGDWHLTSVLGPERANHISPLMDGLKNHIMFTIHHDAPVTPPDLLTAIYAAVNRTTRSGIILGADQRISPYEALKAITINAADQWGEEATKGSLVKGKRADLVILDKNPLKVAPATIKDIKVMETIKDGTSVYTRPH